MIRSFKSPAAYVQGRDALDQLGDRLEPVAESALVLADADVLEIVGDRAEASLRDADVEPTLEEFNGEASEAEIDRLTGIARETGADAIVGAGGGKALDTAKAVRENAGGAMVSLPTIASTDAPTSALSVIYSDEGEFERYWFYEAHPDLVLVDTAIVAGAPARFFRSGIADAMATWFEADAVRRADGENFFGEGPTRAAHSLSRLCYDLLREHGRSAVRAVEQGTVTESVEAVTEANTLLSGLGFENGGIAAAHSIHNGLTQLEAAHGATHGEKVNVGTIAQLVLEGRDDAFVDDVIEFSIALGLPVTLEEVGVDDPSEDDLERVARATVDEGETIHNAFDASVEEVRDALVAADDLGARRRADD
ncbi:glycerol dehydrogenase [Natronococcus jeotgali]|uniref:Glycerol dehydrogenase n=1 Tax=Natronococcus jeotgali DSM 18795 TaxID=1227498 RepID=L9X9Z9_9EURY|nr:glycerol dehydrogenase [Natronococcus jeotgali]ELY58520.1 glycerol dehydrogenase [Natronococcus jeotgali DSM 18795]